MKLRVGIDVGGTFTDVTAFDEDQGELVAVRKYVSNPAQPAAVIETITADLARDFGADAVTLILHGSTAALNTQYHAIVNDVEAPLQKGMSEQTMARFKTKALTMEVGDRGQSSCQHRGSDQDPATWR